MSMLMQLLVGRPALKNAGCQVFKKCARRAISSANLTIEPTKDTSRFENRPANKDLVFGTVSVQLMSTPTPYWCDVSMIRVSMIVSSRGVDEVDFSVILLNACTHGLSLCSRLVALLTVVSSCRRRQTFSDHMLTIEWTTEGKWGKPKIVPYQDLKISPAASCLHYGA
jgi:hypothetical protein